jgi:hypothetical protein
MRQAFSRTYPLKILIALELACSSISIIYYLPSRNNDSSLSSKLAQLDQFLRLLAVSIWMKFFAFYGNLLKIIHILLPSDSMVPGANPDPSKTDENILLTRFTPRDSGEKYVARLSETYPLTTCTLSPSQLY